MRFKDRTDAGRQLAAALAQYADTPAVVLALPRGGVVPGAEVARALRAPLDLVIPRKIGHPFNPEYAIGAVTEEGPAVWNEAEVAEVDPQWVAAQARKEQAEASRRRTEYLAGQPPQNLSGKVAILVDDGIATGHTMLAAVRAVRARNPQKIVVAVPVTPADTALRLGQEADELVALDTPDLYLGSVGAYYDRFDQVEDEEVKRILAIT